jgi:hypothetical protein
MEFAAALAALQRERLVRFDDIPRARRPGSRRRRRTALDAAPATCCWTFRTHRPAVAVLRPLLGRALGSPAPPLRVGDVKQSISAGATPAEALTQLAARDRSCSTLVENRRRAGGDAGEPVFTAGQSSGLRRRRGVAAPRASPVR